MSPKEQLEAYGFSKVGYWSITTSAKTLINYYLNKKAKLQEDLNYAFVEGEQVFYIGVTTNTLTTRMKGYKYGKECEKDKYAKVEASTNKKIYKHILRLLNREKKVDIYALQELDLGKYRGLRISSVSGIEHSLIREFDNGELLNNRAIQKESKSEVKSNYISEDGRIFEMSLGKENYLKGKIGLKKKSCHLLPNETGVTVNIIIENKNIIQGTFTKSGSTLSINGKEPLKKWYSDNFELKETIFIEILDSKNIAIFKTMP